MAAFQPISLLLIVLLLPFMAMVVSGQSEPAKGRVTHFHFYVHDIYTGPNPYAVKVAQGPSNSIPPPFFGFGDIFVFDDLMTEGPSPTSAPVGRSQGLYAMASQKLDGLFLTTDLVFTAGKYNGSTVSIMGRDGPVPRVRELSVIGGSGLLRLARGYAHVQTYQANATTGDAILEWNVYVSNY